MNHTFAPGQLYHRRRTLKLAVIAGDKEGENAQAATAH
jgi:hypothetical protein